MGLPLDLGRSKCWLDVAGRAGTGMSVEFKSRMTVWEYLARKRGYVGVTNEYKPDDYCK